MAPPRLVYLVTEDWYFISHRLPMAQAAKRAGYEVHVATRVKRHGAEIEAHGLKLHQIGWRRGSPRRFSVARSMLQTRGLYLAPRTRLSCITSALQPSVVGSLAAVGLPMARVNAIAGLGYAFTGTSLKARIVRNVLVPVLRRFASDRSGRASSKRRRSRAAAAPRTAPSQLSSSSVARVSRSRPSRRCRSPPIPCPSWASPRACWPSRACETLIEASRLLRRRGIAAQSDPGRAPDARNPPPFPKRRFARGEASPASPGSAIRRMFAQALGSFSHRRADVARRGGHPEGAAGGSRLRQADRRDRCSRLPRDRSTGP